MEIRATFLTLPLVVIKNPMRARDCWCVLFTSFGMFETHFLMIAGAQQPAGGPEGWCGRDGTQGLRPV